MKALLDENFNNDVLRGLLRQKPDADILRVRDIPEIASAPDPIVLEWAAQEGRMLFAHAYARVEAGKPMPGVFEVSTNAPVGDIIEDMFLVIVASQEGEWESQVRYLTLR